MGRISQTSPPPEPNRQAVKRDGYNIQYIHNPSKEVMIRYLMSTCPNLLMDPSFDLKEDK